MTQPELLGTNQHRGWRTGVVQLGGVRSVVLITVFSVLLSVLLTHLLWGYFEFSQQAHARALVMAATLPIIIAPLASGLFVTLVFELEATRKVLGAAAMRDSLTGLFNRRYFMEQLQLECERAHRLRHPLALLMIDVDEFKRINDRHGHPVGDSVLRELARTSATSLRKYDLFARYGGEEFVVLLPATNLQQASVTAERIRAQLAAMTPLAVHGDSSAVTVSLGVAEFAPEDGDGIAMLERADRALYAAKRAGRNRWAC